MKKINCLCFILFFLLYSCKNERLSPKEELAYEIIKKDSIPKNTYNEDTIPKTNGLYGLPKPFIIPENDTILSVRFWNELSENGQSFQLDFATILQYSSGSYRIKREVIINAEGITMKFDKVPEINFGDASIGSARTTIKINQLENGVYPLTIEMGDSLILQSLSKERIAQLTEKTIRGKLIVDKQFYELVLPEQKLVKVLQTKVMKLPKNMIWGDFQYNEPMPNNFYADFLEKLKTLDAKFIAYPTGDYIYFKIDEKGETLQPSFLPATSHSRKQVRYHFIFEYLGDISVLDKLIRQYHQQYLDADGVQRNIWISMQNSQGKRLYSWAK